MASFVPLPSPYNPYVGMAEGAASAGASVYNAARAAKAQAAQRATQEADKKAAAEATARQQQWQHENEIRTQGGVPLYTDDNYSAPAGRPTLVGPNSVQQGGPLPADADPQRTPTRNPQAQGEGTTVTEPISGKQYFVPSEATKAKTKYDAEAFDLDPNTPLGKTLSALGVRGKIKPSDSHSLVQALNEAAPKDEAFDIDTSGKFLDAQGNPVAVTIGRKTGTVRPLNLSGIQAGQQGGLPGGAFDASQMPAAPAQQGLPAGYLGGMGGLPGGAFDASQAQPAAAPAQPTGGGLTFRPKAANQRAETLNDWINTYNDPNSTPQQKKLAKSNIDLARAGQDEADKDRHAREKELADDRAERMGERASDRAEKQAKSNREIERTKKKAIDTANKKYRDAMKLAFTPEAKKAALDDLRSDLDEAQRGYESDVSTETGQDIPHSTWGATYDPNAPAKDPAGLRPKGKADPLGIR